MVPLTNLEILFAGAYTYETTVLIGCFSLGSLMSDYFVGVVLLFHGFEISIASLISLWN